MQQLHIQISFQDIISCIYLIGDKLLKRGNKIGFKVCKVSWHLQGVKNEKKFESADYVISIKFIFGESYTLVFQSNHQTFSLRNQ